MIFDEGTELVDAVFTGALQICRFICYESFMMLLDCWCKLARTPRANARYQESEQELLSEATASLFLMTHSALSACS